jgi:hypothetical protein
VVDLLEEAGHGGHNRRAHLAQEFAHLVERRGVVDRDAAPAEDVEAGALEDVRERKDGERNVGREYRQRLRNRHHVGDEIRVRQHDAFGLARRARSVDDGREVFASDFAEVSLERLRVGAVQLNAAQLKLCEHRSFRPGVSPVGVEEDDSLKTFDALNAGARVAVDFPPRNEQHARARIFKDVSDLFGSLRRVDGHVDRAEAENREVDHRPIGPVLRQQRHAVALPHA